MMEPTDHAVPLISKVLLAACSLLLTHSTSLTAFVLGGGRKMR